MIRISIATFDDVLRMSGMYEPDVTRLRTVFGVYGKSTVSYPAAVDALNSYLQILRNGYADDTMSSDAAPVNDERSNIKAELVGAYYYIVYTNFIKPYVTRKIYIDRATCVELRAHNKNAIALDTVSRDTDALRRNGICCTVLRTLQHYSKHCSTTASIAALQQALQHYSKHCIVSVGIRTKRRNDVLN